MTMPKERNIGSEFRALLGYGRLTPFHGINYVRSYEAAQSHLNSTGNHWSSTENSANNSWNVNFNSGNSNNNNKYNANVVRPAVAHPTKAWLQLRKSLQVAYEDCCKGKSSSKQYQDYIPHANEDLDLLTTQLIDRTYEPSTSTCFLVRFPKLREVFAASFRDRIIHHWICLRLVPHFEEINENMGNVTHNCRVGFGTKSAVNGVAQAMKHVSYDYGTEAYIFKGDLVGFFMSLPQRRMCDSLIDFAQEEYHGDFKNLLIWLLDVVVMHRPELNCIFNSSPEDWKGLAHNKSLFRTGAGRGAPIGNLTTQLFANFYMADFDAFMMDCVHNLEKHKIRAAYHRFVDDFCLICNDKKSLQWLIHASEIKIKSMDLVMHRDKRYIQPISHGVLFVGTQIKNGRLYLSNRTVGRFFNKAQEIADFMKQPNELITSADLDHILATLNSYLGFCKYRQTYRIRRIAMRPLIYSKDFKRYFKINRNVSKVTLKKEWKTIIR